MHAHDVVWPIIPHFVGRRNDAIPVMFSREAMNPFRQHLLARQYVDSAHLQGACRVDTLDQPIISGYPQHRARG